MLIVLCRHLNIQTILWWHCSFWIHCPFSLSLADAPPHGLGLEHDGFPDGCPTGNDPLRACRMMVEKGIVLYCVGCEPSILRYKDFFMGLAYITGGQYVPLSRAQGLSQVKYIFLICILWYGVSSLVVMCNWVFFILLSKWNMWKQSCQISKEGKKIKKMRNK